MLEEIAQAWRGASYPVVFTGAGMSTESGLPDFRSAKGLWKQRPESLATVEALATQPKEFYFFYQWRIQKLWEVSPNGGHEALAKLEKAGRLRGLITQNVDGLHQRAESKNVLELHGTLRTVSCLSCARAYDSRQMSPSVEDLENLYKLGRYQYGQECFCPSCGGNLRPDVILFGETLPQAVLKQAEELSHKADFFVVVGSSLQVSPANFCPQWAVANGAKLLIINNEPTSSDSIATWIMRESSSFALDELAKRILNKRE